MAKELEENGRQEVENNAVEIQLPDRVVHPKLYEQEETNNIAY